MVGHRLCAPAHEAIGSHQPGACWPERVGVAEGAIRGLLLLEVDTHSIAIDYRARVRLDNCTGSCTPRIPLRRGQEDKSAPEQVQRREALTIVPDPHVRGTRTRPSAVLNWIAMVPVVT